MNWRDRLRRSYEQVTASGGFYALDVEYYFERSGSKRHRHYRLLWSNRLAAFTGQKGTLVKFECGPILTGPPDDAITSLTEILEE